MRGCAGRDVRLIRVLRARRSPTSLHFVLYLTFGAWGVGEMMYSPFMLSNAAMLPRQHGSSSAKAERLILDCVAGAGPFANLASADGDSRSTRESSTAS